MKRISVIIPVYNSEKYLYRCVTSILPQLEYDKDELLIINDGSTDNSLSIVNDLVKQAPVIRCISKPNEGIAKTRNRGIEESSGEYILFVDNDDYLDSDYIQTFYKAISESGMDVVIGGYRRVTQDRCIFSQKGIESDWYKYMVITPWGRIFRREVLVKYGVRFLDNLIGEDVFFNFSIYNCTGRIRIIPYIGYNWMYNMTSVSNSDHKGLKKQVSDLRLLDKLYEISSGTKVFNAFCVKHVIWHLLYSGRSSSSKRFMEEYEESKDWLMRHDIPFSFPVFGRLVKGESLKNRMILGTFLVISKLRLMRLFSNIYCKG